jgi:CRP/FNR family transcriptional regulator
MRTSRNPADSFALPNARFSHVRCGACPIRERAVCAYSSASDLEALDAIKTYRDYAPGREILAAGEQWGLVGSVVRGVVKLTKTLADGRTQMVGLLFPGDFVGHAMRARADYDAVSATSVTLCLFQRKPFKQLIRDNPRLEHRMLEMTLNDLDAAREWLLLLGRKTAREKLASFLLMLGRRVAPPDNAGGEVQIDLPLTRAEIAEYLGLTIETVSRQMTKLRGDGVIAFESTRILRLPDLSLLEEEAGV